MYHPVMAEVIIATHEVLHPRETCRCRTTAARHLDDLRRGVGRAFLRIDAWLYGAAPAAVPRDASPLPQFWAADPNA